MVRGLLAFQWRGSYLIDARYGDNRNDKPRRGALYIRMHSVERRR